MRFLNLCLFRGMLDLSLTACSTLASAEGSGLVPQPPPAASIAAPPAPAADPNVPPSLPKTPGVRETLSAVGVAASEQRSQPINTDSLAIRRSIKFECTSGSKVQGLVDRWSPLSTCPAGYQVTGLGRIDLQGDHNRPLLHVNDFICDDRGCKAWCIGDGCTVEARCCRVSDPDQP